MRTFRKVRIHAWGTALLLLLLIAVKDAMALESIDFASGADQSFVLGQSQRSYGEKFHTGAFAVPLTEALPDDWQFDKAFTTFVTYDSNLFLKRIDPKDDLIYTYNPKLSMKRKVDHCFVSLLYDLGYVDYVETQKQSHTTQHYAQSLTFNFSKTKITLSNDFKPNRQTVVGDRTELGSPSSVLRSYNDTMILTVDYDWTSKTKFSAGYGASLEYFPSKHNSEGTVQFSAQTHSLNGRVTHQLTPKTKVYLETSFSRLDYTEINIFQSRSYGVNLGVSNKWNTKTALEVNVGYGLTEYDEDSLPANKGLNFKAAVSRKLTEKIQATLFALHTTGQTYDLVRSESFRTVADTYGAGLTWKMFPHVILDAQGSALFSQGDGFASAVDPENPTLTFTRAPEDQVYDWSLKLGWNPRPPVTLGLGYMYRNQNGSFKGGEYDSQKIVGLADIKF